MWCRTCNLDKPEAEFYRDCTMTAGITSSCKACIKERVNKYRVGYRKTESHRLSQKQYRQTDKYKDAVKARRDPQKHKAHRAVHSAVRDGRLIKESCEICGDPNSQGHHDDYDKPLEVRWLCQIHHSEHHAIS